MIAKSNQEAIRPSVARDAVCPKFEDRCETHGDSSVVHATRAGTQRHCVNMELMCGLSEKGVTLNSLVNHELHLGGRPHQIDPVRS